MLQLALAAVLFAAPAVADTASPAAKPEASAASQAQPTPAPAAKPAKSAEPAEKLICRRDDSTGNRTSRAKLCMTKKQWKEFNRSN